LGESSLKKNYQQLGGKKAGHWGAEMRYNPARKISAKTSMPEKRRGADGRTAFTNTGKAIGTN